MIAKFSLLGMEALALDLTKTAFLTVTDLLTTKDFLARIAAMRNRLGLGFVVGA